MFSHNVSDNELSLIHYLWDTKHNQHNFWGVGIILTPKCACYHGCLLPQNILRIYNPLEKCVRYHQRIKKNYYPSIYLNRINQEIAGSSCQITRCVIKRKFFQFHRQTLFYFQSAFFFGGENWGISYIKVFSWLSPIHLGRGEKFNMLYSRTLNLNCEVH